MWQEEQFFRNHSPEYHRQNSIYSFHISEKIKFLFLCRMNKKIYFYLQSENHCRGSHTQFLLLGFRTQLTQVTWVGFIEINEKLARKQDGGAATIFKKPAAINIWEKFCTKEKFSQQKVMNNKLQTTYQKIKAPETSMFGHI